MVYGHRGGWVKSDFYDAFVSVRRGLFNTRERGEHCEFWGFFFCFSLRASICWFDRLQPGSASMSATSSRPRVSAILSLSSGQTCDSLSRNGTLSVTLLPMLPPTEMELDHQVLSSRRKANRGLTTMAGRSSTASPGSTSWPLTSSVTSLSVPPLACSKRAKMKLGLRA